MDDKKIPIKAIKRIQLALMWLIPIVFVVAIFQAQMGTSLTASEIINFNQEIYATNPVQSTGQLEPIEVEGGGEVEKFSIIQPLDTGQQDIITLGDISNSIITFQGQITYPNVDIVLEFGPEPFFVSLTSDEFGRWTWTNYGQPFEPSEYLVRVYSFVPTGKRDLKEVFVEHYSFNVIGGEGNEPVVLYLDQGAVPCTSDEDCLKGRLDPGSDKNLYLFTAAMQNNKIEYAAGQEVGIELLFTPLIEHQESVSSVRYEIFSPGTNSFPIVTFNDHITLGKQYSFSKKFTLNGKAIPGTYLIKIVVMSAGDVYIGSTNFQIAGSYLQTVGGGVVSQQDVDDAMLWNIIFVLVIISGMLVIAGIEFRRFYVFAPIDEEGLQSKGYF